MEWNCCHLHCLDHCSLQEAAEDIPGCQDCDETDIEEWINSDSSYELLNDDQIVQSVMDDRTVSSVASLSQWHRSLFQLACRLDGEISSYQKKYG